MTNKNYEKRKLLHQLFEINVAKQPDAVAMTTSNRSFTYQELADFSNRVAHRLVAQNVRPNTLVAIVMDKGWEEVVAVLGILKSGAAYLPIYVPIELTEFNERLSHLLKTANVDIILTQKKYQACLEWPSQTQQFAIDDSTEWENFSTESLPSIQTENDLAYVMFTSGSTGMPKGVMIDHRGAINTIEDINRRFSVNENDNVIALSALNFDLSVYDIFGTFTAGATLVIPDAAEIKEPAHWRQLLDQKSITIWSSAPALMQMLVEYLVNQKDFVAAKTLVSSLRLVMLSGDWIPIHLPEKIRAVLGDIEIVSLGGATEASIWSILYPIKTVDPHWKSIPYGKAMKQQTFYILDESLQPVAEGISGGLYIGGIGLAKGYWGDAQRTSASFIYHPLLGRLYKTGDKGRYLPDGNIEFQGRIDYQVKIRGYPIELNTIESCLLDYPDIEAAIVVPMGHHDRNDQKLVAYIVTNKNALDKLSVQVDLASEQVSYWQKVYVELDIEETPIPHFDPAFNISGWISSYTRHPIPTVEMQEWVDNTVEHILSFNPQNVLEIGCGTGLLLFQIAPKVAHYTALDFVNSTLARVKEHLHRLDIGNVDLHQAEAIDFPTVVKKTYDTIILNSVVQYFPNADYLIQVLKQAVATVKPGGHLLISDIRSLIHLRAFHASVQLFQAKDDLEFSQWQTMINRQVMQEDELIIHPDFFYALKNIDSRINHVEIQPKRGKFHNEMNRFRYDVTLHIGHPVKSLLELNWLDWKQDIGNLSRLRQLLNEKQPPFLAIKGVPNKRVAGMGEVIAFKPKAEEGQWIAEIKELLYKRQLTAIDPESLYELCAGLPYQLAITYSQHNPLSKMDVVFYQHSSECGEIFFSKLPGELEEITTYTNEPLKPRATRRLLARLNRYLQARLEEYKVPSAFVVLDEMPVTANGKIDRQALLNRAQSGVTTRYVPPKTKLEKYLVGLWSKLFNTDHIGIYDNFFELGGSSLLAVQILTKIHQDLSIELMVKDIVYSALDVASLSKLIEKKILDTDDCVTASTKMEYLEGRISELIL